MEYTILHVSSIDSTNTALKQKAREGAPDGTVLVADMQSAGRGRLGRSFYSPIESGLYVSILLRPTFSIAPAHLTCLAAVAVADAIESYGKECSIKWVNDIWCTDKKAGGILTEGALRPDGTMEFAVIGIGVNLTVPSFVPDTLKNVLTGVFERADLTLRDEFLERLLERISIYYNALPCVTFWEKYNTLQNCFGKKVFFQDASKKRIGIAQSIDRQFRLIVRSEDKYYALERGEVTFES